MLEHFRKGKVNGEIKRTPDTARQISPQLRTSLARSGELLYAKNVPKPQAGAFLHAGSEQQVHRVMLEKESYVVKTLKPTAREILVFGRGFSPQDALLVRDHYKKIPESLANAPLDADFVVGHMRNVHALATAYLGEGVVMPTDIFAHDGAIHRMQRFFPQLPVHDPFEITFQTVKKVSFYEDVEKRWKTMLGSDDFKQMPELVQVYCRAFPPDNGVGSNALFRGSGCKPEFVLIDF